jgi:hypothetical protein
MVMAALPAIAEPLDHAKLKTMLTGMGYTPKETGVAPSQLLEVSITTASFNVPVGLEVSGSGRFVWARATLGDVNLTGEQALEALRSNANTQPVMFWLTSKNQLVIGMAIDNRDITPEQLRFALDKIAVDVTNTAPIWNKPQ